MNEPDCLPRFAASWQAKFMQLLNRKVFLVLSIFNATDHWIYGARFTDEIENIGTLQASDKSRLVGQSFNDNYHNLINHAPTVVRVSQRILICIGPLSGDPNLFIRYVDQA